MNKKFFLVVVALLLSVGINLRMLINLSVADEQYKNPRAICVDYCSIESNTDKSCRNSTHICPPDEPKLVIFY